MMPNALYLLLLEADHHTADDLLAELGVPPDVSPRIKVLVLKGLLYEREEAEREAAEMQRRIRQLRRPQGRPKRSLFSINAQRAIYVHCLSQQGDRANWTNADLIRTAMSWEARRRKMGLVGGKDLLWGTDEKTLEKSVSLGWKELRKLAGARGMKLKEWLASVLLESQSEAPN